MQPDLKEIQRLREHGNVIPVYKSVIADFLTPVSAFLKLEKDQPYAFLLESVEGGETLARYSFLGCNPFQVLRHKKGESSAEFMQNLRSTLQRFRSVESSFDRLPSGRDSPAAPHRRTSSPGG